CGYGALRDLHSFPTRRSSDLDLVGGRRGRRVEDGVIAQLQYGREQCQHAVAMLRQHDPAREAADWLEAPRELPFAEDRSDEADGLAAGIERITTLRVVRPRRGEQHPVPVVLAHLRRREQAQKRINLFEGLRSDSTNLVHGRPLCIAALAPFATGSLPTRRTMSRTSRFRRRSPAPSRQTRV